MKSKFITAALLLAGLTAFSAGARETVYNAGPFDRIAQLGDIDIVYSSVLDPVGMVFYDSDRDFSDALKITNKDGHLSIKEVREHGLGEIPVLRVYSDYLSEVKSEGDGTIEVYLTASTPVFSAKLIGNGRIVCDGVNSPKVKASITTGNGNIVLRGRCTEAKFELTGTGVIQADELEAVNVRCAALGTGSIGCWPEATLDVRGIGTTKIYYRGEPKIKKVGGARLWQIQPSDIPESTLPVEPSDDEEEDSDE